MQTCLALLACCFRLTSTFTHNSETEESTCPWPQEDEAARAYDRMMLWCEIHGAAGSMKGTMTNFDMTEYEKDIAWLTNIAQVSGRLPVARN